MTKTFKIIIISTIFLAMFTSLPSLQQNNTIQNSSKARVSDLSKIPNQLNLISLSKENKKAKDLEKDRKEKEEKEEKEKSKQVTIDNIAEVEILTQEELTRFFYLLVKAIIFDENGNYIVVSNPSDRFVEKNYYQGELLFGGWQIEKIEKDKIYLNNSNETISLSLLKL